MAGELDGLHKHLDGADSEYCTSDADILVDQVRLDHAHGEDLVEVVEPEDHHSLVVEPVDEQTYVVQTQSYGLNYIVGVLVDVLEKLLDVGVAAAVQVGVVDVDHHILEVVLLLVPLEVLLEFWQTESFEEHLDAKMFEIVWLYNELDNSKEYLHQNP